MTSIVLRFVARLVLCAPLAIVLTFFMSPFWSWLEATYSIESMGHSGPAEWCYVAAYSSCVLVAVGQMIYRLRREPSRTQRSTK